MIQKQTNKKNEEETRLICLNLGGMWYNYRILQIEVQLCLMEVLREIRLEVPVKVLVLNDSIRITLEGLAIHTLLLWL